MSFESPLIVAIHKSPMIDISFYHRGFVVSLSVFKGSVQSVALAEHIIQQITGSTSPRGGKETPEMVFEGLFRPEHKIAVDISFKDYVEKI